MKVDRLAGLAGILFFVLGLTATLLGLIDSPDFDAQGAEIKKYFVDEEGRIIASLILYGLAGFAFLFFLGGFHRVLRSAEGAGAWLGNVASAAGVAGIATLAASGAATFAAVFRAGQDPPELSTDSAQTLFDIGGTLYLAAQPLFAAFLVASALIIISKGGLPNWLGWAAALIGVTLLVPLIAWATFGLAVIWVAVVSVVMLKEGLPKARATRRAAPRRRTTTRRTSR